MTETGWLASTDPSAMLLWLTRRAEPNAGISVSNRKLRLFACACCRQVWDGKECPVCGGTEWTASNDPNRLMRRCGNCGGSGRVGGLTDPRSRRAVEVAERYADGDATEQERRDAYYDARQAKHRGAISTVVIGAAEAARYAIMKSDAPPATQAALLRDIFGNPFRPARLLPPWATSIGLNPVLTWNYGTVPKIAEGIYGGWKACKGCGGEGRYEADNAGGPGPHGRYPMMTCRICNGAKGVMQPFNAADMPILADALLDAGCDDEDMLRHCRGQERCNCPEPGCTHPTNCKCHGTGWCKTDAPHVRGCWVLDLILGKE